MRFPPELTAGTLTTFQGRIERADERECRIRYPFDRAWCNPRGTLQGGMFAVFLDDAMSFAVVAALGLQVHFTSIDMTLDYHAPVGSGDMVAIGRVIRAGRRVIFVEGEIENKGVTAVRARSSALLLPSVRTATGEGAAKE